MKNLNKIVYFDKETINNILQEMNKGNKLIEIGNTTSLKGSGQLEVDAQIKLSVPLIKRIAFLFSGKISANILKQYNNTTTITSTEISEFEKLKSELKHIENIQIKDIENSSTFFRVAGGYLKMMKDGVDEVDIKEFNDVMNSFEGYDTYRISKNEYVRFNNSAFVSNYKRNDLLTTKIDLFCIFVGKFKKEEFDFIKQINKMQTLITNFEKEETLAELFPSLEEEIETSKEQENNENVIDYINLYDVVYASISIEEN